MIPLENKLQEVGKIKIGMKGERRDKSGGGGQFRMPVKLDHFIVTMNVRDQESDNFYVDRPVHDKLTQQGDWTRLPIRFLFPTIEGNWSSSLEHYVGRKRWCHSSDATKATRLNTADGTPGSKLTGGSSTMPCEHKRCPYFGRDDSGKVLGCKPFGTLSVLLPWSEQLGGIYKFRTTSWSSIQNIQSQLQFFDVLTRGNLHTVDFELRISPKSLSYNSPDGPKGTTIFEVGVFYPGDAQKLYKEAKTLAESLNKDEKAYILMLKDRERYLSLAQSNEQSEEDGGREVDEKLAEFFPEVVVNDMAAGGGEVEIIKGEAAPVVQGETLKPPAKTNPAKGVLVGMEDL